MTEKASATTGSSRRPAAPRAGFSRHASVHAPISGSAARAADPRIPASANRRMSETWPEKTTGGHSWFFTSSSSFNASTAPMVAAPQGTNPQCDVLKGDETRPEHRARCRRPHPCGGAVDVQVGRSGRDHPVIERDPVGADVTDPPAPHHVLDRAQRAQLRHARRRATERLRLDTGVDAEEHLGGLETVREVPGVLRNGRCGDPPGLELHERSDKLSRLREGPVEVPAVPRSHPPDVAGIDAHVEQPTACVHSRLAATDDRELRGRELGSDEVIGGHDHSVGVDAEPRRVPSMGSRTP